MTSFGNAPVAQPNPNAMLDGVNLETLQAQNGHGVGAPTPATTQPAPFVPKPFAASDYMDANGMPTDQNLVAFARAVKTQEGGDNPKVASGETVGGSGEKGAYQWMPGNFETQAKSFGLDPSDFSNENQNKVAYLRMAQLKSQGLQPYEIASKWNSGGSKNWQDHSGTNPISGVTYDTPTYVKGVMDNFTKYRPAPTPPIDTTTQNPMMPTPAAPSKLSQSTIGQLPGALKDTSATMLRNVPLDTLKTAWGLTGGQAIQAYNIIKETLTNASEYPGMIKLLIDHKADIPGLFKGKNIGGILKDAGLSLLGDAGSKLAHGDVQGAGESMMNSPIGSVAPIALAGMGTEDVAGHIKDSAVINSEASGKAPISTLKEAPKPITEAVNSVFGNRNSKMTPDTERAKLDKAEAAVRQVFKLPISEVRKETAGSVKADRFGTEAPNSVRDMAQNDLIPSEKQNGKMTVADSEAALKKASDISSKIEDATKAVVDKVNPLPKHDLMELRDRAANSYKNDSAVVESKVRKDITDSFDAEIKRRGMEGEKKVMATDAELLAMKRGLNAQGDYNKLTADGSIKASASGYRGAGHVLKTELEQSLKGNVDFENLNKQAGKIAEVKNLLTKLDGMPIQRGRLSRIAGDIAGGVFGSVLGGPVVGVLGAYGADRISEHLNSVETRLGKYRGGFKPDEPAKAVEAATKAATEAENKTKAEKTAAHQEVLRMEGERMKLRPQKFTEELAKQIKGHLEKLASEQPNTPEGQLEAKRLRAMSPRSGDFNLDLEKHLVVEPDTNANGGKRYFLKYKDYPNTPISQMEANTLKNIGTKFKTAGAIKSGALAYEMSKAVQKINYSTGRGGKFYGKTFNLDGSVDTGKNYIATLYSKTIPSSRVTPDMIQKIVEGDPRSPRRPFVFGEAIKNTDFGKSLRFGIYKMDNGHVSVDINISTPSEAFAKEIGKRNNQKSIFNQDTKSEIPTGGNGVQKMTTNQITEMMKKATAFNEDSPVVKRVAQKISPEHETQLTLSLEKENSKKIADAFDTMKHEPSNPKVAKAYDALTKETVDQYKALSNEGIKIEPWNKEGQPYASSAEMVADLNKKHLYYYPTEKGFGQGEHTDNPMLKPSGVKINGKEVPFNDIFRAVHDAFGHGIAGNQFGPIGEENAWRIHSQMFSPEARRAMTTETRGQNSWVNFGKHMRNTFGQVPEVGLKGFVSQKERTYAPQKTGLLPDEFVFPENKPKSTFGPITNKGQENSQMSLPKETSQDTSVNYFGKKAKTFDQSKAQTYGDSRQRQTVDSEITQDNLTGNGKKYLMGTNSSSPKLYNWRQAGEKPGAHFDTTKAVTRTAGPALRDVIHAEKLFKAYPNAKNLRIKMIKANEANSDAVGYMNRLGLERNGTYRHSTLGIQNQIYLVRKAGLNDILDTLRHEIQHHIQDTEHAPRGGNLTTILKPEVAHQLLLDMRKRMLSDKEIMKVASPDDAEYINNLIESTGKGKRLNDQEIRMVFGTGESLTKKATAVYEKLQGEQEARGELTPTSKSYKVSRSDNAGPPLSLSPDERAMVKRDPNAQTVPVGRQLAQLVSVEIKRATGLDIRPNSVWERLTKAYGSSGKLDSGDLNEMFHNMLGENGSGLADKVIERLNSSTFGRKNN